MLDPMIDTDDLLFRVQAFLGDPGSITPPTAEELLRQCYFAIPQLHERLAAERAHRLRAEKEIDDGR